MEDPYKLLMKNINKKVQELIYSDKYYLSIKRNLSKSYWKAKKMLPNSEVFLYEVDFKIKEYK